MPTRKSQAQWEGSLKTGRGRMTLGSAAFEGPFSFGTRFEETPGTNPEELIAAAHAGCFSMALAAMLEEAGYVPESIRTTAEVHLDKADDGFSISRIMLNTMASVPGIEEGTFQSVANKAKNECPVSKALAGVAIDMEAGLEG